MRVQNNQSIIDICILSYGDLSYLPKLINDNNISYTENLRVGDEIVIVEGVGNNNVKNNFIKENIIPANKYNLKPIEYLHYLDGSYLELIGGGKLELIN